MGEGQRQQQGPNAANAATQATSAWEWERQRQRDTDTQRWCVHMISSPGDTAAEPLLYDTTRCDDCLGAWCVFAGIGSPGCISGNKWANCAPIWYWHVSIGCYMVVGIHIALGGTGAWETKHGLPAGIDTYSIAGWAETITGLHWCIY